MTRNTIRLGILCRVTAAGLLVALLSACHRTGEIRPEHPNAAAPTALPAPPTGPSGTAAPQEVLGNGSHAGSSAMDPDTMVAHFINVGQGDATLLEFSCAAMLIDTGGESTHRVSGNVLLQNYLEAFFARRPDLDRTLQLVVLSHPHADHTHGVSVLLNADPAIRIMNVVDDGTPGAHDSGRSGQVALESYAQSTPGVGYAGLAEADIPAPTGLTSHVIDPINCHKGGSGVDPKISAFWGRVHSDQAWATDPNNNSVVLRVAFGKSVFLFMGDLRDHGISAMLDAYSDDLSMFDADVLKVGHHGSANGTTADLVAAVTPKIAVIQSGDSTPDNEQFSAYAFGHPNTAALALLLDPTHGVSMDRSQPAVNVRVGVKGRNPKTHAKPSFTTQTFTKAIYDNAWDGNIDVTAKADGDLSVQTEH